jgi:flagellar L-ring protein precursor FlgH
MNKLFLSACESAAPAVATPPAKRQNKAIIRMPAGISPWILASTNSFLPVGKSVSRLLRFSILAVLFCSPAFADSLWKDDVARPLVGDKRAVAVGDILTIVVQESTTTAKDNSTKTARQAGVDANFSSFLYPPSAGTGWLTKNGQLPAMKFNSKTDYAGGGTINNSERIVARIAVRVIDILPNRNLVIEGSRETSFSGEKQTAILRGTVRSEDIAGNNTVLSYNIADATIKFVSTGTITDSQRKGWFFRLWEKIAPF